VKAFEQDDFDAVTRYFDATMKKELPSFALKTAWMQINTNYGELEKADLAGLKETHINQYDVIEVPFYFQKEKLNLQLTFNGDGTVGGMFFLPVE
jgi:hypothetical protein